MQNDYRLGEWLVRPQRGSIERGDEVIHLKPKVMAVLDYLAAAGGKVVSRDDLFEKVWPGQVGSDAALTQCVVELRQAFRDSARHPQVIETIPKIGFRLIPAVGGEREESSADELATGFIEFKPWLGQCRFNNCVHASEPDCAIKQAVADGHIRDWRYQSYLRLLEQNG